MIIENNKEKNLSLSFKLGEGFASFSDKICAFLMALLPLLQHYKGPYKNMGFTVILLLCPILFFKFLTHSNRDKIDSNCAKAIFPLLLFELYTVTVHQISLSRILYGGFMILIFIFMMSGVVNVRLFFKSSLLIAKIASIAIIAQTVSYYVLKYHIRIIPVNMLLEEGSDIWINRSVYGISRIGEMYRPSGIFLEPSHLFLYTFPLLCMLLLLPEINKYGIKDAIIISLSVLLSTSGFGIVCVVMLWIVYRIFYKDGEIDKLAIEKLMSLRTWIIVVGVFIILIVAYNYVPIIRNNIKRIFDFETGTSVAIDGRVNLANNFIKKLSGSTLLFGVAERVEQIDFNMAGFHATLYKWGIIGVVLTYIFYGQGIFRLKQSYFYMSLIIVVVSYFSAHTHGTFFMMYFTVFLMNGYYMKEHGGVLPEEDGDVQCLKEYSN